MVFPYEPEGPIYVRNLFDLQRGFATYHEVAKSRFLRRHLVAPCPLIEFGAQKFKVVSETAASAMCDKIDGGLTGWSKKSEIASLLTRVFNPEIDSAIVSHFESEYCVRGVGFEVRTPADEISVSQCWHCDAGPLAHLVMMVYFTASEPDGANTVFAERAITDRLKDAGYVFCNVENRLESVDDVLDDLGLDHFSETTFEIAAGEAIIFDAPNLMHKGWLPKRSPRYVMFLGIMPSIEPWTDAFRLTEYPKNTEEDWVGSRSG